MTTAAAVCASLAGTSVAQAAPGDLDPTYGEHGIAKLPDLGQPLASFRGGSLDSAGRFVGLFRDGSRSCVPPGRGTDCVEHWRQGIARLSRWGAFDMDFGTQGTILFPFDQPGSLFGLQSDGGMLVDPDGRGYERVLPDGTVDWKAPEEDAGVQTLVVLPDDSFLTGGGIGFSISKRTSDGTLDPSFGDGGTVVTETGRYPSLNDLALGDEGKIWAVGSTTDEEFNQAVMVVRYEADGSLDTSFSGDGIATFDLAPGQSSNASQATVDSSGRLIVGGYAVDPSFNGSPSFTMAVTPDGEMDPSYGDGGFILGQAPPLGLNFPTEMVPLDDNRVLMLQEASRVIWVADGNGRLDESFGGTDSMVQLPAFNPVGITPASGGTVLAYGSTPGQDEAATARFLLGPGPPDADADGVLDPDDSCPDAYASATDGCPTVKRVIELRLRRRPSQELVGQVHSVDPGYAECPEQSVRIRRKYAGRTKLVARVRVSTPGGFSVPIEHKRGLYVARLRDQVTGPSGHCLPARSEVVGTPAPSTTITKQPKRKIKTKKKKAKVTVKFTSDDADASFKCKLDKAKFKRCSSPYKVKARAKRGKGKKHRILVKAKDAAGNVGEPAAVKFRVIRKR